MKFPIHITFPTYYLIGFLNSMGWPKKTGLFIKKEVVNSTILFEAVQVSVKNAIALGVARPNIAVNLLADLFSKRDWAQESTKEIWDKLDPHEEICNNPNKTPEETIAPLAVSDELKSLTDSPLIEWKFVFQEEFQLQLHWRFEKGLVWGLSHPKEALACHEEEQQEVLKELPAMLKAGVDLHPLENLNEFAERAEEIVNSFQREIHPLVNIPKELLNLPEVKARISQPDLAAAHFNLGVTYGKLRRYQDAVEAFKQAIKIKPDDAEAHYGLGLTYGKLGHYQDAIEAYKQALKIKPDLAEAHYGLGTAYGQLRRDQDAIESYKHAVGIKPDYVEAHCGLGVAYEYIGRYQDAIEAHKQALKIKPDYAEAHCFIGIANLKLGRPHDIIKAYKQAIRIKPNLAGAHYMLGVAYLMISDKGLALKEYKILKTLDAEQANKLFNLIYP